MACAHPTTPGHVLRRSGPSSFARWRSSGDRDFLADRGRRYVPSKAHDERFIDWYVWYSRRSASPAEAVAFHRMMMDGDVRDVLRRPCAARRSSSIAPLHAKRSATSLRGSRGRSWSRFPDWWTASAGRTRARTRSCSTTRRFVGGVDRPPIVDRVLATVLFTDIVGSTERASELGDEGWRRLLGRHHEAVRRVLEQYRGCEVGTAGDGLATFDGPARAVRAAVDAREALCGRSASRSAQAFTQARSRSLEATRGDRRAHGRARSGARCSERSARLEHRRISSPAPASSSRSGESTS